MLFKDEGDGWCEKGNECSNRVAENFLFCVLKDPNLLFILFRTDERIKTFFMSCGSLTSNFKKTNHKT